MALKGKGRIEEKERRVDEIAGTKCRRGLKNERHKERKKRKKLEIDKRIEKEETHEEVVCVLIAYECVCVHNN